MSQHTLPDGRVGKLGECRSCHATVVWAVSGRTGRTSPYDLDGKSHFATCVDAESWRRVKK